MILDPLSKSYPCSFSFGPVIKRAAIFGSFVFVFLFFFQPFGLNNLPDFQTLLIASLGFGIITLIAILTTNWLIPLFIPSIFNEDHWTILKEIGMLSLTMTIIACLNSWYLVFMHWTNDSFSEIFLIMELYVLGIGIMPISFFIFYDQNKILKEHLKGASNLSEKITSKGNAIQKSKEQIVIQDENGKDEITIASDKLIHISSDRNYLDIFAWDNNMIQKTLIRNRLHLIDQNLTQEQFFRCHRSHIVNLNWVESVRGNARGYELQLKHSDAKVPVSRNKIAEMERHLDHLLG